MGKDHIYFNQVALGWNRPDFAKKILSTSDKEASDKNALGSLMIHALVRQITGLQEIMHKRYKTKNFIKNGFLHFLLTLLKNQILILCEILLPTS